MLGHFPKTSVFSKFLTFVLLTLFVSTDAEFVISLLNIAAIFDFTKELQDTILQE